MISLLRLLLLSRICSAREDGKVRESEGVEEEGSSFGRGDSLEDAGRSKRRNQVSESFPKEEG